MIPKKKKKNYIVHYNAILWNVKTRLYNEPFNNVYIVFTTVVILVVMVVVVVVVVTVISAVYVRNLRLGN